MEKEHGLSPPSQTTAHAWGPNKTRFSKILVLSAVSFVGFRNLWHWSRTENPRPQSDALLEAESRWLRPKEAEALLLAVPNNISAHATSLHYASKPHLAGSTQDRVTALDFLTFFQREFGIPSPDFPPIYEAGSAESQDAILSLTNPKHHHDPRTRFAPKAWIDTYYPVLSTPLGRQLQVLEVDGDLVWEAELEEVADGTDPVAGKYADAVGAWHGFSKDADVQGRLVYANYGLPQDFEALVAEGVNLTSTIALIRYGKIFRGLKVKAAQEAGCIGALIYSDTRDDGSVTAENGYLPYPYGPARNPTSVQRGSVQFLSMYPGDPTTPGYPSYANATRQEPLNIPSIPSLPISPNNAKRLLLELEGKAASRVVRLVNHVDTKITPVWNAMAVLPGLIPDEIVVLGNHRDAWVMGAGDPTSGIVALQEVIKGLGVLMKRGWRPLRTILIASWDGEEYGLVGSTEWGEDFADWVQRYVVAYFNLDIAASGSRYSAAASPSIAHLLRQAATEVAHPTDPGRTLWDARLDRGKLTGPADPHVIAERDEAKDESTEDNDIAKVTAMGSGSDYTVMLQRLGIASSDMGFSSTLSDPVYHYHSVYDTPRFFEVYSDTTFQRHVAVAKQFGLMTLRMANSFVLPLNTTYYSSKLGEYLTDVELIIENSSLKPDLTELRSSIVALQDASLRLDEEKHSAEEALLDALHKLLKHRRRSRLCAKRRFCKAREWILWVFGVSRKEGRPSTKFEEIDLDQLLTQALTNDFDSQQDFPHFPHFPRGPLGELIKAAKRVRKVNSKLSTFEQGFISEGGIKDREWYRHLGTAPGKWKGYGATTFPALTEALSIEKNMSLAQYEVGRLSDLITKLALHINI